MSESKNQNTQIQTFAAYSKPGVPARMVSYEEAVKSYIVGGYKIPSKLFKVDPSRCQSMRDKRNSQALGVAQELVNKGYSFTRRNVSKTGTSVTLGFRKITDGTAAQRAKADTAKIAQENAELKAKMAEMQEQMAALMARQSDLNALEV